MKTSICVLLFVFITGTNTYEEKNPAKIFTFYLEQVPHKKNGTERSQDSAYYHVIKKGDTFHYIADYYYSNPKDASYLEILNPSVDPGKLKIGDSIIFGYPRDTMYNLRVDLLNK